MRSIKYEEIYLNKYKNIKILKKEIEGIMNDLVVLKKGVHYSLSLYQTPVPVIVTDEPTSPLAGEKLEIEGATLTAYNAVPKSIRSMST